MRVIFSRKGFDSAAGGCPSPVVDGRPISFPIPTRMPSSIRYGDLAGDCAELIENLTNGKINRTSFCHLDPDININMLPRLLGWRGCLGQVSAAQAHLANNNVGKGDLFLFWGLFRPALRQQRWEFSGVREHRIFGWLQIGDILDLGHDGTHALRDRPWLKDHPHVRNGWGLRNALYIASDNLFIGDCKTRFSGYGLFSKGLTLSASEKSPSLWKVPKWLNPAMGGIGMTYHPLERWQADGTLQTAARGQEFISLSDVDNFAHDWLIELFENYA